jgi:hypothetical protein
MNATRSSPGSQKIASLATRMLMERWRFLYWCYELFCHMFFMIAYRTFIQEVIIEYMKRDLVSNLKINRSAFSVASLTDESDEKAYWLARTPYERLRQVEILRRINYGYRATSRLQRVLEITEREKR